MAEPIAKETPKAMFLRTLVSSQLHDRLTEFAKQYQTGMEKWDYGVAIQILLDFWDYHQKQASVNDLNAKVEMILAQFESLAAVEKEPTEEEKNKGKTKLMNGEYV